MIKTVGHIITGSLCDGFYMRITPETDINEIKTGKFVCTVDQNNNRFFSLITDLKLEVAHPDIITFPPSEQENLLSSILGKKHTYATAHLKPMIMLNNTNHVTPVKVIPRHFAAVKPATEKDIALVFGKEDPQKKKFYHIGSPLDMNAPVCIDLEKLTERSNGIFGKTGTGKTFLTRLVLAGLIKNDKAVNVIFDMHSEYGLQARKENSQNFVKGLKTLWPDKVAIFSLDPESTRRRGASPDVSITLNYQSINVEDILSLQEELNLHATACEAAYLVYSKYKKQWLEILLSSGDSLKELSQAVGAHPESIGALYRKLKKIERLPFFSSSSSSADNIIKQMMEYIDRDVSIIIEFGNFTSTFCYLLIANIITRAIHSAYIKKTEKFLGSNNKAYEPKKLMITIEEAHKFLNPSAARQTIFGIIAREMRKYYVSLLVVDQRPSSIDPEVLSQIGTKIIAQLSDEKDINAALTGTQNASYLRSILSTLDSKKQVLLQGHAVTMPIVIETREYDEKFYNDMSIFQAQKIDKLIEEIF